MSSVSFPFEPGWCIKFPDGVEVVKVVPEFGIAPVFGHELHDIPIDIAVLLRIMNGTLTDLLSGESFTAEPGIVQVPVEQALCDPIVGLSVTETVSFLIVQQLRVRICRE